MISTLWPADSPSPWRFDHVRHRSKGKVVSEVLRQDNVLFHDFVDSRSHVFVDR